MSRSNSASRSTSDQPSGRRRSTRTAVLNGNGKRVATADPWSQWRGERRSTRLGAPLDAQLNEPPPNRARTEESSVSAHSVDEQVTENHGAAIGAKQSGAAAIKPTEVALEQVAGRKRSKFWYYAVEPIPSASQSIGGFGAFSRTEAGTHNYQKGSTHDTVGHGNGSSSERANPQVIEGSLSPAPAPAH